MRWGALFVLACVACSTEGAGEQRLAQAETLVMHERARQVTVSTGHGLARLDSDRVEEGVAGAILLNSELIVDGVFHEAGLSSTVDGGRIVGTMHGQCTTIGGALSLGATAMPGSIAKCEQGLNFYDRGQVLVSGLIEQQNFEHNVPQHLAVVGGTGRFAGARGELIVTQLVFPGVVKRLELRLSGSVQGSYFADLAGAGLPNQGAAGRGTQPMVPGVTSMSGRDAGMPPAPAAGSPSPAAGSASEPKPDAATPMSGNTPAQLVERGRYLVHHVAACTECHTPRDVIGRLDPTRLLSGVECFRDGSANRDKTGCLHTGNLTNHETGLKNRSDAEIKAMILDGTRPDGRALHPTMPYWVFGNMEAADADAIVAYLRTVPGIPHMLPPNQAPFRDVAAPTARWPATSLPAPLPAYSDQAAAARGRYLAATLGSCIECHTPRLPNGLVDTTRAFRGGLVFQRAELGLPAGIFPDAISTANLTPHADGLAGWTVEDVVAALKLGRDREGKTLCPPMPGGMGAFGGLTDQDARDIGHYLLSLPPGEGKVVDECAAPF